MSIARFIRPALLARTPRLFYATLSGVSYPITSHYVIIERYQNWYRSQQGSVRAQLPANVGFVLARVYSKRLTDQTTTSVAKPSSQSEVFRYIHASTSLPYSRQAP